MIGIVIPAFNEEKYLEKCIDAIKNAIGNVSASEVVKVLVVLDHCEDASKNIIQKLGIDYLECTAKCVGIARDLGVRHLIAQGAKWIACTDADSLVDQNWLKHQILHQPTDVICGVVEIESWEGLSKHTREIYLSHYQDRMEHRHIHGANLSFSADAYLKSGGFPSLCAHEDVQLVERMCKMNMQIVWSNLVRVITSSRLISRAPEGFSKFLLKLESEQANMKDEIQK